LFEKLGKDAFDKLVHDNHAEYEAAVQYVAAAKAHRQELRARKRLKLQSTGKLVETVRTRPFIIDSNSDSDTPLMRNVGMRSGARSTRETRPRTPTAQQSSSSAVSSISSENSNDSLMEQLKTNDTEAECRKPRRKPVELIGGSRRTKDGSESLNKAEQPMRRSSKSVPNKSSDPKGQKQDESARPSSSGASRPLNSPDRSSRKGSGQLNWQPDIIVNTPTAAATRRSSNVTDNENIKVPGPLAAGLTPQLEKPTQSMRRSAPAIKMVNEPKSGPLRSAWHKGGDQAAYSKMHFRRKAELRGRNEATPDPTALSFINAPPGLMASKSTQLNDNLYARRDTTNTRPARSNDSDDEAAAPSTTQSPDWEKEKVPMTCFEWRNGSCRYGAEVCWFLHRDTAKIGPANGYVFQPSRHSSSSLPNIY
jgi:chromo domain-containing protein 1